MATELSPPYKTWIVVHVPEDHGYGKCAAYANAMAKDFPELEVRFGFFHSVIWGRRQHFWCRHKESNDIVDPTGLQHPDGYQFYPGDCLEDGVYEDLTDLPKEDLESRVPTGVCANCGKDVYKHAYVCSKECALAFEEFTS